ADRGDRSDRGGGFLEGGRFKKSPALDRRQRPVWTETARPPLEAPQLYECPLCQKPIRDILTAISDKVSGLPLHFDCVLARLNETEQLGSRDAICYLGAGRFGVVHYDSSYDSMGFRIKKVLELEDKEVCGKWRRSICERFL
ncbi:MAG: hypothetical protein FWG66_00520, partial [Spirochaetes bacterium]|nr:hypothetical protein [Spirochaetota bacterium]